LGERRAPGLPSWCGITFGGLPSGVDGSTSTKKKAHRRMTILPAAVRIVQRKALSDFGKLRHLSE